MLDRTCPFVDCLFIAIFYTEIKFFQQTSVVKPTGLMFAHHSLVIIAFGPMFIKGNSDFRGYIVPLTLVGPKTFHSRLTDQQ